MPTAGRTSPRWSPSTLRRWTRWRDEHGRPGASLADAARRSDLRDEIETAVERANRAVSRAEQVKTFRILPRDLTEADGELTPTLKIKRNVVRNTSPTR